MKTIREFKCPFCNVTIDTYRDEWTPFNCPSCNTLLSMETVSNHYDQLAQEYIVKVQKINSISVPKTIDEQLQFTLKQYFEKDNGIIGVWKYAGMPIKLSDIETNLDYKIKNPNVTVLIPGPKLQAKKSTAQLLLYFFITYKNISTINNELYKIIYERVDKEDDYVTLNFYFNCLSNYKLEKRTALLLLINTINRLDIKFFDYADVYHFANTKFPELKLFKLTSRKHAGPISNEECLQTIKETLQDLMI